MFLSFVCFYFNGCFRLDFGLNGSVDGEIIGLGGSRRNLGGFFLFKSIKVW